MTDLYQVRALGPWTDKMTENRRGSHLFKVNWTQVLDQLATEVDKIDGEYPLVLQVDVEDAQIRRDGMLRMGVTVGFPGVVLSFNSKFGPLRLATDAYEKQYGGRRTLDGWQANVRAIGLTLEALRSIDRWGVTKRGEQYRGWAAIEAPKPMFAGASEAAGWMMTYAVGQLKARDTRMGEAVVDDVAVGEIRGWAALYRWMARRMHPDTGAPRADWDRLAEARRLIDAARWK